MAGYACVFHDGEAEALHIHQTLGQPGVTSVCDECQPVYLITTLAAALGVDSGALYDVVRSYQVSVQANGEPPAAPDAADEPPMPAGPHPVGPASGNLADGWDWCSCDAPGPHHADGSPIDFEAIGQLQEVQCSLCEVTMRGTTDSIDGMIAHHQHTAEHQDREHQAATQ